MSERWVTDFLPIANTCRPAPAEVTIPGVMCCCFDNLSMKIDYSSYSTEGETGRLLDMTNWFSTKLPAHLAPNFDAEAICTPSPRHPHHCLRHPPHLPVWGGVSWLCLVCRSHACARTLSRTLWVTRARAHALIIGLLLLHARTAHARP